MTQRKNKKDELFIQSNSLNALLWYKLRQRYLESRKKTLRILCVPSTKLRTGSATLRAFLSLFCLV